MTPEELTDIKSRANEADRLIERQKEIRSGLDKLGECSSLKLDFNEHGEAAEVLIPPNKDRWQSVCWARNHKGLVAEIKEAVRVILVNRLQALNRELEEL